MKRKEKERLLLLLLQLPLLQIIKEIISKNMDKNIRIIIIKLMMI